MDGQSETGPNRGDAESRRNSRVNEFDGGLLKGHRRTRPASSSRTRESSSRTRGSSSRTRESDSPRRRESSSRTRLDTVVQNDVKPNGVTFNLIREKGQHQHDIEQGMPESTSRSSSKRGKLVKPERSRSRRSLSTRIRRNAVTGLDEAGHGSPTSSEGMGGLGGPGGKSKIPLRGCCGQYGVWHSLSRLMTCCFCDVCLRRCGGRQDAAMRQAWREKTALCLLIFFSCLGLAFLTFGLTTVVCRPPDHIFKYADIKKMKVTPKQRWFFIHGYIYNLPEAYSPYGHGAVGPTGASVYDVFAGKDVTPFFPYAPSCAKAGFAMPLACRSPVLPGVEHCHTTDLMRDLERIGQVTFDWQDIEGSKTHLALNGYVLDIAIYLDQVKRGSFLLPFGPQLDAILRGSVGGDATRALMQFRPVVRQCLLETFGAGTVDIKSVGCILTDVILYVSLVAILAVILIKFFLAVFFTLFLSKRLRAPKTPDHQVDLAVDLPASGSGSVPGVRRNTSASMHSLTRGRAASLTLEPDAKKRSRYSAALQKTYLPRASFSQATWTSGTDTETEAAGTFIERRASLSIGRLDRPVVETLFSDVEPKPDFKPERARSQSDAGLSIRRASLNQLPSNGDTPREQIAGVVGPTLFSPLDPTNNNMHAAFVSPFERTTPNLVAQGTPPPQFPLSSRQVGTRMYTLMVVTCYSEGESGLKSTIDSLVKTEYPDDEKLLFIVADGLVHGEGNAKITPEIVVDLIEVDPWAGYIQGTVWSDGLAGESRETFATDKPDLNDKPDSHLFDKPEADLSHYHRMTTVREEKARPGDADWLPPAYSYVAIADGEKRHNMARVYAGHYHADGHRVPALVVIKCGTPAEALSGTKKPGNRGKRDSQIILMSFLSKVLFRDRMTPLEYDLFLKIRYLMHGLTPDLFEAVLCVDADTVVAPSALSHLTAVFHADPMVMGLCGETKIANKTQSWVTAIQVFEYFISHHLNKAFESIFGGVTCLPGCFCMYRIKAPKYAGASAPSHWVPILASPDIVNFYAENVTDTLHKKNLLLLGEDRYLTTLLLRTFPKRKMLFVPMATCKTLVPDSFSVLLSQRRRWINSTVHNLFELVLVNDLCGTFCCSMQFVIFMELVGTLVLPAAILFTGVLLLSSLWGPVQWIPLFLLVAILGLPALLILFTARSPSYILFMLVYLLSLPIWNFVLPAYAFWHFDDFSWGQTRQISQDPATAASGVKENHGGKEGEFDHQKIVMKYWHEYERHWSTWIK